ncbi:helix-turn-helix domain-containing protein [Niabella beijingensis]|uniref:helix-turn-helix domain-containing protein n=1 Tax=Niabella beijingensis TaxID=2872700 RepID=UPI001CC18454|nr:helix-turn-helix domain-containing protein [Niabella beijingensis]MBZ4190731.1 helix-turn-helix domain-containing protein [Niabella beijingensis]
MHEIIVKRMGVICGEILKDERQKKGISIADLCRSTKVPEKIIEGIEMGKYLNKVRQFVKIIKILKLYECDIRDRSEELYIQKYGRSHYRDDEFLNKERYADLSKLFPI